MIPRGKIAFYVNASNVDGIRLQENKLKTVLRGIV